jgi:two-component sensor histidine kinase
MRVFHFLILPILIGYQNLLPIQRDKASHLDSVYSLAGDYLNDHKFEQAIKLLYLLEKEPAWIGDLSNLRKTYNNLGFSYYKIQKYDSSLFFYVKSNELAIALQDTTRIIASFNSLAMGYSHMGLYGLSLEKSQSALELAQLNRDDGMTAHIQNTMALTYYDVGDITGALTHHRMSLATSKSLGDSIMMAYGYHNIARCHQQLGEYDSSLFYNRKALDLKEKLSLENSAIVTTINNIGLDFLKLDSLSLAEKYLARSHSIYRAVGDQRGLALSYNNLSDLAIRRKQFQTARAYLDSGALILDQIGVKELQADHLALQVTLMENIGQTAEALAYYKELAALKEEIFQQEKLNVQEAESNYLLRGKELERANAAQEAAFVKATNQRYLQLIAILAFSVIATGGLIYFLLRFNRILKVKNNIIRSQKEDLKHRTFNVLMRVQSLIRMASENLTDENSKQVLANSEAAILSAAALQQHLSHDGENSQIMLGHYLEDLVGRLEEVFHLTGHPISYKVDIREESSLPTNTVLNVGIIVAELVTNASKHAFTKEIVQPEITVRLEKKGANLHVSVQDNGVGLPLVEKQGIGTGLVKRLAGYIKAELSVQSETGTFYTLKLPA